MVTSTSWRASRIYEPLLFLVYINNLTKNLSSTAKIFADNTSIFLVVHDVRLSSLQINDDLMKISN